MDITLERILSLIPKKPDGKFVHGAKQEFAQKLGLKSGNLVSDWIKGRSHSYNNYLYAISHNYNVSVEWLRGETNIKSKQEIAITYESLIDMIPYMTKTELLDLLSLAIEALKKQEL